MENKKYEPTDKEKKLCEWVYSKFKQSYVAKAPLMKKWQEYMSAYEGTYFKNESRPDYKSNQVSNLVFSTIEAIRPIMTDNNPKFIAVPTSPEGQEFSTDVQMALDFEWEREKLATKLPAQLIPMLVYGTAVWFVQWNGKEGEYGNINIKPIDPFNIFPDPLAENIDNSEYIVYATYKNANQLKQMFPIYINELTNQIIDNAKSTANMQWIIDKNSGIGQGKLTNRPGLVIRKNPGSEVRRDTPPPMPTYVRETIDVMKADIQDISGVLDSLKGEKQTGVVAASAILALQEASQSRIRLKIKIMESNLSELANMVYSRMQQFWKLDSSTTTRYDDRR